MQLIYGEKQQRTYLTARFTASSFLLSVNPILCCNEQKAYKMIEEVIVPYIINVRKRDNLKQDQKSLLGMDLFSGQIVQNVINW